MPALQLVELELLAHLVDKLLHLVYTKLSELPVLAFFGDKLDSGGGVGGVALSVGSAAKRYLVVTTRHHSTASADECAKPLNLGQRQQHR